MLLALPMRRLGRAFRFFRVGARVAEAVRIAHRGRERETAHDRAGADQHEQTQHCPGPEIRTELSGSRDRTEAAGVRVQVRGGTEQHRVRNQPAEPCGQRRASPHQRLAAIAAFMSSSCALRKGTDARASMKLFGSAYCSLRNFLYSGVVAALASASARILTRSGGVPALMTNERNCGSATL